MESKNQHLPGQLSAYIFFVTVGLLVIHILFCLQTNGLAEEIDLSMQEVSYTTTDKVTIYGSWITLQSREETAQRTPTVILLHDYGLDRRDWGIFIPDLVHQGYNVLAIDLRGHGQSQDAGSRLSGQYSSQVSSYLFQDGHLDVHGALQWIKGRDDADPKNVSVIGVGLGAEIAYICAGKFKKQIRNTVVISPSASSISNIGFVDLEPRSVLFCTSAKDAKGSSMIATETLANFTEDPKRVIIYNSAAHGLAIFYKHPEIKQHILHWLKQ